MGKKFYSSREARRKKRASKVTNEEAAKVTSEQAAETELEKEEIVGGKPEEKHDAVEKQHDQVAEELNVSEEYMAVKRRMAKKKVRRRARRRAVKKGFLGSLDRTKLTRYAALGALGMVIMGVLFTAGLFAWYSRDLPSPDRIVRTEGFSTKILDRDGELLYEVFADQQRTPVELNQVPEYLQQATVATEDQNFYDHEGFDPVGIMRGFYLTLFTSRTAGGSTLTQQLVKNVLLTSERSIARKVKEFILAVQIESRYNKEEILQMYLNEAPYGGTAWGVQSAAQLYFNKDVMELDLVESAILAGMPQRPSVYTPFGKNPEAYIPRTEGVLRRMREDGYIDQDQEASAAAALQGFEFNRGVVGLKAPHFSLYVKEQLEEMYGAEMVEKGGLLVTTTLNSEIQNQAQEIVAEEVAEVEDQGIGNGAAMVMDSETGEVWAMVGSKNYFDEEYDGQVNVVMSERQPGSAIKPVTYATALAQGFTPASMVMDVQTEFPSGRAEPYVPVNYDGQYRGPVQLRFALGSSLNVPAVKLLALVGVDEMLSTAYRMGFTTLEPTQENMNRFGLSVTLGGGEVRLYDMVAAYSSFSNGGSKVEPVTILKVEDRDGSTLFEHQSVEGERVLDESVAFLINHMLTDNNARLLTFGANSYLNMGGRSIAVKTGTTNDKRDNWTVGWSNKAVVGVWVGNNDNSPMNQVASGVTGSSPIWRRIMLEVLNVVPDEEWRIPDNVQAVMVDTVSGYPEHDGYPARSEYVADGTLPALPDPIHTKLRVCKGKNKLATEVDIARGEYDEKEFFVFEEDIKLGDAPSWQAGIDAWTAGQGDERYRAPTEFCDTVSDVEVRVEEPKDQQEFDGNDVDVKVKVISQGEVRKVEIVVDGSVREELVKRPFETKLNLSSGQHTIKVRAETTGGDRGESGDIRIGVGGEPWEKEEPTPTPEPTDVPDPTETPTPIPTP